MMNTTALDRTISSSNSTATNYPTFNISAEAPELTFGIESQIFQNRDLSCSSSPHSSNWPWPSLTREKSGSEWLSTTQPDPLASPQGSNSWGVPPLSCHVEASPISLFEARSQARSFAHPYWPSQSHSITHPPPQALKSELAVKEESANRLLAAEDRSFIKEEDSDELVRQMAPFELETTTETAPHSPSTPEKRVIIKEERPNSALVPSVFVAPVSPCPVWTSLSPLSSDSRPPCDRNPLSACDGAAETRKRPFDADVSDADSDNDDEDADNADASDNAPNLTISLQDMNDLSDIDPELLAKVPAYYEGASLGLGEGGRELLRKYIKLTGFKGRALHSTSIPKLLWLARDLGLWDIAVRIHLEFKRMLPFTTDHWNMREYKAVLAEGRRQKRRRLPNISEGTATDDLFRLDYYEGVTFTLGSEGRRKLLDSLREVRSISCVAADSLLAQHNLRFSRVRDIPVAMLLKMCHLLGVWHDAQSVYKERQIKMCTKP